MKVHSLKIKILPFQQISLGLNENGPNYYLNNYAYKTLEFIGHFLTNTPFDFHGIIIITIIIAMIALKFCMAFLTYYLKTTQKYPST